MTLPKWWSILQLYIDWTWDKCLLLFKQTASTQKCHNYLIYSGNQKFTYKVQVFADTTVKEISPPASPHFPARRKRRLVCRYFNSHNFVLQHGLLINILSSLSSVWVWMCDNVPQNMTKTFGDLNSTFISLWYHTSEYGIWWHKLYIYNVEYTRSLWMTNTLDCAVSVLKVIRKRLN